MIDALYPKAATYIPVNTNAMRMQLSGLQRPYTDRPYTDYSPIVSATPEFILKSGVVNIYVNENLVANGYGLQTLARPFQSIVLK